MIKKINYEITSIPNDSIATDSFYHTLLEDGYDVMDKALDFYSTCMLTKENRYSGFTNKIISVKE